MAMKRLLILISLILLPVIINAGIIVNDNFNRANQLWLGTSTSEEFWAYTTSNGHFSIVSNTGQTTLDVADVAYIDSGVVTCSVYFTNVSSVLTNTGLACRIVDNNNFIAYTNFGQLIKKQGGSFTVLANEGTQYVQNDIVRIDDDGSTIKCYINGSLKITYNTTLFNTATKQGLYWGAGGSPNMMVDDYAVDDLTVANTPTITQTNTPTSTPTITQTATPSPTITLTATPIIKPAIHSDENNGGIWHRFRMWFNHNSLLPHNIYADFYAIKYDEVA
jgi:hypothetical protein